MERASARQVSVAKELRTLGGAVDALKLAADRQTDQPFQDVVSFARAVGGALILLRDRLHLLERVVRRSANPSQVACRENEVHLAPGEMTSDLIIPLWSAEELVTRWEYEWKVAKARLDRERNESTALSRHESPPQKPCGDG